MSNIKQSDVKNHLSPRFNPKIHLCQPESEPDATGFSEEEPAGAEAIGNDSAQNPPGVSPTGGRESIAGVAPKSAQD